MAEAMKEIREARPRRFRPYPEYRDSGVEWLGEVPARWQERKLGYLVNSISGGIPSKDNPEFWRGDIPWVSPKDMKVRIIRGAADHVSEVALSQTGLKLIEPPAVLIVVRGMILAHTFPVAVTAVPVTINQDMRALRLRQDVSSDFFAYLIEGVGRYFLSLIEEAGHGTKRLRSDLWRSTKLFLPTPDEQRAIASFLDRETAKIDGLVAKKERLIELLQEKRTALITRAVTQGLDRTVPMKDSGVEWLGEIPAHWELKRVRDVAESLQTGPFGSQLHSDEYVDDGVPVINPANLAEGKLIRDSRCTVDDATASRLSRHRLVRGDILFARRGELGRCGLVDEPQEGWVCGTGCLRFRPDEDSIAPRFLLQQLSTAGVRDWLQLQSVVSTMQNLNTSIIGRLPIALPSRAEQEAIASRLEQGAARIHVLAARVREAIVHLHEFRTALISAAVTGKIDVREEAA